MTLDDLDRIEARRNEALHAPHFVVGGMCLKIVEEDLPKLLSALRTALVTIEVQRELSNPALKARIKAGVEERLKT